MINNPYDVLDSYIDAGCDIITIHVEACIDEKEFEKINNKIICSGVSPGLAINPNTELPKWIYSYLDRLDVIIIMSVNPGFTGQKFIPSVLPKMKNMIHDLLEKMDMVDILKLTEVLIRQQYLPVLKQVAEFLLWVMLFLALIVLLKQLKIQNFY